VIDVYLYERVEALRESEASEEWEDVPCAPRVGDLVSLRKYLGTKKKPLEVVSVEWFCAHERPTRLHAYVLLGSQPESDE